jgi:CheY-like chemotaxis protein
MWTPASRRIRGDLRQAARMKNLAILYVDDDDTHRNMVAQALEGAGHYVTQAPTADAAIDLLNRLPYDCVVTDYNMPGSTGASVVRQAKRLNPRTTVCVVSGHPKDQMTDLPSGTLLLSKPFSVPLLLDVLTPR